MSGAHRSPSRAHRSPSGARRSPSGAHRTPSGARPSRALVTGVSTALLLAVAPATAASAASGSSGGLPCPPLVAFDPAHFHEPTDIDNRFLPMTPGRQHVYTGTTSGGAHNIVSTVTDLTKVVDGVEARVVRETDIQDGQVTEDELTLFAQDDQGNVWNLAEHPELYNDKGKATGAPDTWVSGLRDAQGGIHMLAHPESQDVRNKLYLQGYSPSIDFLDCARVHSVGGTTTVPVGTFHNVLTTYETSPLEQTKAIQTKEHAPSVGIVRVGAINDPEAETLELTSNVTLGSSARSKIDQGALQLDKQGRNTNKVWAKTPPAQFD
jgi:hypothetical protein